MSSISKLRYDIIDHQVDYEWLPDSPVDILSRDLFNDKIKNKTVLSLKMLNTTDKGIKSVFLSVECLNEDFETVYENDNVRMANVNVKPHSEFGDGKFIQLGKSKDIKTVFVSLKKVIFADETEMEIDAENDETAMLLPPPDFINPEHPFYEKIMAEAEQSKIQPVFWYEKNEDYWRCTCGQPNKNESTVCSHCLASKQWLDEHFAEMAIDNTIKIDEEEKAKIMAEVDAAINEANEQREKASENENKEEKKEGEANQAAPQLSTPPTPPKTPPPMAFYGGAANNAYASVAVPKKETKINNKKLLRNILIFTPICVALCIGAFYLFMFKKPSDDKIVKYYEQGIQCLDESDYREALSNFVKCEGYMDSMTYVRQIMGVYRNTIAAGAYHTVVLHTDGTVAAVGGTNEYGECNVKDWRNIYAVATGGGHTLGLKSDGTVVAVGYNKYGQCDVSGWTDIIAISAGSLHTVALNSDGQVLAKGYNKRGECEVSDWTDVVAVKCGMYHTVGLKSDGTVIACGDNSEGQCNVSEWTDIIAISAGGNHTLGLKADGTVVSTAGDGVSEWKNIISIASGYNHDVGLMSNGKVVATGSDKDGCLDVDKWKDIIDVYAGAQHTIGLKSDGTLVAVGWNNHGQCDVEYLGDIGLSDEALNFNIRRNQERKEELSEKAAASSESNTSN